MKKIVILLLVLVLAACGGNNDDGGGDDETLPVESSTPTAEPTAKPSPEPTPEPELEIAELSVTEEVLIGTGTFRNKAWSPDSSQIVVSTGAGALLYDAADLSAEPTLLRINGGAWYSTFSPDGTRLATVNEEVPLFAADTQFVHLWDLTTNERVAEFSTGQDRVNRLVFSSDGTLLAGAANDQVYVWDATNLAVVDEINSGEHDLQTVAISPDNNLIAWALLDELHLYARDTGEETIIPFSESQQNTIAFIVFSPDGTQIALSSTSDATLVLDVASGEVVFSDAENRASGDLHYDAEGNLVISEAFDVTVVDPATGEEIAVYTTINARRGLLSPDNTRLMAIEGLRIMVTDTATRKELSAVDLADYNKPPLVLPDYSVIIARQWDSPRLVLLDPADGSEIDTVTLSAGVAKNALSLSSDGARLVAGTLSKTVAVVDTTTWEEIATHEQPFSPVAVAISSDHALVAVASSRSSDPRGVGVIDAETGEEKWFTELEQEAAGLIFSPDDAGN